MRRAGENAASLFNLENRYQARQTAEYRAAYSLRVKAARGIYLGSRFACSRSTTFGSSFNSAIMRRA